MAKHWSIELHTSPHACPPDHVGMAPAKSSVWLRVEDRAGARWVDVTEHMQVVRTVHGLMREAVSDIVDEGAAVVPVRGEDG